MEFNTKDLSAYEVRKLGKNEIIKSFDCGDADLNDFIFMNQSLTGNHC